MKISDLWDCYKDYSKALSDAARQLAFAGFGVVWVFKGTGLSPARVPHALVLATICFIVTVFADYIQYAYGTVIYRGFAEFRELRGVHEKRGLPRGTWIPGELCLLTKTISNIVGYSFVLTYVLSLN